MQINTKSHNNIQELVHTETVLYIHKHQKIASQSYTNEYDYWSGYEDK